MVRLTDCLGMTTVVDLDVKPQNKEKKNKSNLGDSVPSKVQLRQTLTQATVPYPLPNNPVKADTLTQAIAIVFLNGPAQVDTLTQATMFFLTVQLR